MANQAPGNLQSNISLHEAQRRRLLESEQHRARMLTRSSAGINEQLASRIKPLQPIPLNTEENPSANQSSSNNTDQNQEEEQMEQMQEEEEETQQRQQEEQTRVQTAIQMARVQNALTQAAGLEQQAQEQTQQTQTEQRKLISNMLDNAAKGEIVTWFVWSNTKWIWGKLIRKNRDPIVPAISWKNTLGVSVPLDKNANLLQLFLAGLDFIIISQFVITFTLFILVLYMIFNPCAAVKFFGVGFGLQSLCKAVS